MTKKIIFLFKKLLSLKIRFGKPTKNRIVIYHKEGKELLNRYIKENIVVLDPLREIYLIVLFKSLLNFSFQNLLINYNRTFISMTSPKFIFTYIDNDLKFYSLKNFFKTITFVAIQNGYRGGINDKKYQNDYTESMEEFKIKESDVKKLECDFLFTFNKAVSQKYTKFIKTKTLVIGSIKNNIIKKKNYENNRVLSFISEVNIGKNFSTKIYFSNKRLTLPLNDWLLAEKKIIPFLGEYCKKNNLKFQIITKGNKDYEREFYKNLIKKKFSYSIITKKNLCKFMNWLMKAII